MGTRGKHRDNLIHAALRLFRRQGYSGTGLKDILAYSRAPKGSLYHYFPGGKEELGAEAVAAGGQAVSRTLDAILETTASGEEFVRAYMQRLALWLEQSHFKDGCPMATTLLEVAPDCEAIARAGAAAMERWTGQIARAYRRDGLSEEAARRRAILVIAATEGALIMARASRSTAPIHSAALELTRPAVAVGDERPNDVSEPGLAPELTAG